MRFKRDNIALSPKNIKEFSGYNKEYNADCYIVGSNQIWNDFSGEIQNDYTQRMDFYILEFLSPNHKSKKFLCCKFWKSRA